MGFTIKRFYRNKEDFRQFYFQLKQTPCPHCKLPGCLILHGYLYGYDEKVYSKINKHWHRIFCSNRDKRQGCGKTFSVLKLKLLKKLIITSNSLWIFLNNIAKGFNKTASFKTAGTPLSPASCYRLWNKFVKSQSKIRALLSNLCPPPKISAKNPAFQTIYHLKHVFKKSLCPIESFQECFQTPFL